MVGSFLENALRLGNGVVAVAALRSKNESKRPFTRTSVGIQVLTDRSQVTAHQHSAEMARMRAVT